MTERRPPGFNVDLGFYDSEEVLSIPKKIRASAVGVWALAGSYSARKLTDGYVSAQALKGFGCTPAIRAALCSTRPQPLWVDADTDLEIDRVTDSHGAYMEGVRFTRWPKWQRTREEVTAYRVSEAERKRERKRGARAPHVRRTCAADAQHVRRTCAEEEAHVLRTRGARALDATHLTSDDNEMSGDCPPGQTPDAESCPQFVRAEHREPKTKTKTEIDSGNQERVTNVSRLPTAERARDPDGDFVAEIPESDDTFQLATAERGLRLSKPVPASASRIVGTVVPQNATTTADRVILRIHASELLAEGYGEDQVARCLRKWLSKPHLGANAMKSCMTEVLKEDRSPGGTDGKVSDWQALKRQERMELE